MTSKQRAGLGLMIFTIFIIQVVNTPYLMNRGWAVIVIIVVFNIAMFSFLMDDKPEPPKKE